MALLRFALGFAAVCLINCGGSGFTAADGSGGAAAHEAAGSSSSGASSGGSSSGTSSTAGASMGGANSNAGSSSTGGSSAGSPSAGGSPGTAGTGGGAGAAHTCDRSSWTASAFMNEADVPCGPQNTCEVGGPPTAALDGAASTRWSSGMPQAPGQWFSVTLTTPVVLKSLRLTSPLPNQLDLPSTLTLELNGKKVTSVTASSPTGELDLQFPATLTSSIRFTLDQASATAAWWSINELEGTCQ
jgi:hypothetical protein